VRSSQDWGVTGEPEGCAGGGRASEEGGECGGVRATAQSGTPHLPPSPAAGHVGALTGGPYSLVTAPWPGLTVASPQILAMMGRPA
jgi:hypothetical protein